MMTVNEVSQLTGVTIRTLHYYDKIGLLKPSAITEAGYRLYDVVALEKLQQILLFRELEFSLKDIKKIVNDENFDREKAINQQIELLILKKKHLEDLIMFACEIKKNGGKQMDFTVFDTNKIESYAKQAKEQWGTTEAYQEFEEKSKQQSKEMQELSVKGLMQIFVEFGSMMHEEPKSETVQLQVKKLQDYITNHFYTCTDEILSGLGMMYGAGGEFTENINCTAGDGCAEFASKAIAYYCEHKTNNPSTSRV